jgi:hypothetical protein
MEAKIENAKEFDIIIQNIPNGTKKDDFEIYLNKILKF